MRFVNPASTFPGPARTCVTPARHVSDDFTHRTGYMPDVPMLLSVAFCRLRDINVVDDRQLGAWKVMPAISRQGARLRVATAKDGRG